MAAKLRTQNRKMVARAIPLMEKTPVATIISTKVQAERRVGAGLINIVLDSILSDIGAEAARVSKPARIGPNQGDIEMADAGRGVWSGAAKGGRGDPQPGLK